MKQNHKFSKENQEFINELKSRINEFFKKNQVSKYGGWRIWAKVVVMAALYFLPYTLMVSGVVSHPGLVILMWSIMGFGMAGLGLNVMHDANHGALSKNKSVNHIMSYTMNIIGGSSFMWKLQHNVLHHSFTNIEGSDSDMDHVPILRFSPHKKWLPIHRFQFVYAWFLYSLLTLSKLVMSDFTQLFKYRRWGLVKDVQKNFLHILAWKLFYVSYALVIPLVFINASVGVIILGFVVMHLIAGFILSAIFQTAHIMPTSEFPLPDANGYIDNDWAIHQLSTTCNYSPKDPIFSWFVGGLNFQVEHHLFQSISHVHYRKLSKIVKQTAEEFKVPYYSSKSFLHAIYEHTMMLKKLGATA